MGFKYVMKNIFPFEENEKKKVKQTDRKLLKLGTSKNIRGRVKFQKIAYRVLKYHRCS